MQASVFNLHISLTDWLKQQQQQQKPKMNTIALPEEYSHDQRVDV